MSTHRHKLCAHAHAATRRDPTKTTVLRAKYERDLVRRFQALKKKIRHKLVTENAFGLHINAEFDFPTDTEKVQAFMDWVEEAQREGILEVRYGQSLSSAANDAWQNVYLRSAYQKGLASAALNMRADGVSVSDRWIDAGFYRPIHADAVGMIYTRAYSDLEGITDAMDAALSRELAQGMTEGLGMEELADSIDDAIDGIGIVRARTLARTETIRAHADATLNTYKEAGIEGVEVMSEFTTAGDESVCPECDELSGDEYTIEEAQGVIPVHPNCRCAWLPVVTNPEGIELL